MQYKKKLTLSLDVPPGYLGSQQAFADFLLGLYSGCCSLTLPVCDQLDTSQDFCYTTESSYTAGVASGEASENAYCLLPTIEPTCGNTTDFLAANEDLILTYVFPIGISLAVFGALLLFGFLASCSLLCRRKKETDEDPYQDKQYPADEIAFGRERRENWD